MAKRGLVGAWASELKPALGPPMDSCRYSILWVESCTIPWVSDPPLLALPLELVVSIRLDGTWGSAWISSHWERARRPVLSEGS